VERVDLDGVPVEYELVGAGEAVVLLHARPFFSWFEPMAALLRDRAVLRYRRPAPDDPLFGIQGDAELCTRLLAHVGMERPHVVGHSYGGLVALELARQRAVDAWSLALLEPATNGLLPPAEAATRMAPLLDAARVHGPAAAMEEFLRMVCGDDARDALDQRVPGAFDDALAHADGFFAVELPAVIRWSFGPADAAVIDVPIVNMRGSESAPRFVEGAALIQAWFPAAQPSLVPGVNHLLMAQDPVATAERLERFWRSI
jgi:pimeloyl-ACP methyl ester carboxylesterase